MKRSLLLAAALLTLPAWELLTTATAAADEPTVSLAPPPGPIVEGESVAVVGHPDPLSLLKSDDPVLAANKRLVFDMWRGILNAGHVELADELLAEGYTQHSPLLPTGRAAFKQAMSVIPRRDEIPDLIEPPVIAMVAEGDLVTMTFIEELPEPDGSGTYTTTHFNMFRIEDGRLAEHWHSLQGPPGPDLPLPEDGGPQRVTGATGIEQLALVGSADPLLAANKRLVFDMYRNVIEANREELADLCLAEDYIQHNPNVPTGREAVKTYLAARDDLPIEASLRVPLVASVAEGDLVVQAVRGMRAGPIRRPGSTCSASPTATSPSTGMQPPRPRRRLRGDDQARVRGPTARGNRLLMGGSRIAITAFTVLVMMHGATVSAQESVGRGTPVVDRWREIGLRPTTRIANFGPIRAISAATARLGSKLSAAV